MSEKFKVSVIEKIKLPKILYNVILNNILYKILYKIVSEST